MTICYHLNTEYDLKACQTLYGFLTFTKGLDLTNTCLKMYLDNGEVEDRDCTILVYDSGFMEYCGFVNRLLTKHVDKTFTMSVYDFRKLFQSRRIEL